MTLSKILEWQQLARPEPTEQDKQVSLGIHLEEVAEMLDNLTAGNDKDQDLLVATATMVARLSSYLKNGKMTITPRDPVEHLDSLGDQIVTAIGDAYLNGFDIIGALEEINTSNWSKFEDGKPIFNEKGKVIKGKDYFRPNLKQFS